jgi:hypothetical protein
MPFRDPNERIARVGQGFSKMLSIINPEQISRYEALKQASTQEAIRRSTHPNFHYNTADEKSPSPGRGVNLPKTVGSVGGHRASNSATGFNEQFVDAGEGNSSARKVQTRIMTRRRK